MHLTNVLIAFASLVAFAFAVDIQKSFIVSYPNDTPDWVLTEAMNAITSANGVITHEYTIIKGFAATAGEKVLENVQALGTKYNALVEEDESVSIST